MAIFFFLADSVYISLMLSTFLVLIFLVQFITKRKKSPYNLPPGPTPLPLIGNLHLLDLKRLDRSLMKLSEKYGPIFTIHLGMNKAIVLTGAKTIKEALVGSADKFSDRAYIPIFHTIQRANGVFFSSGETWKITRRFTMSSMKNLGMGKKYIEDKIIEELQFITDKIESYAGQPFKLKEFACAPTNITLAMLFGKRFDYNDPVYMQLLDLIFDIITLLGLPSLQVGVFFSSGETWKITRRFTMSSMKNLGMGKKYIEDKIIEELQFITDKIESYAGQPFKLKEFACAPTNITLAMLFGKRFDYNDPVYMQLLDLIFDIITLLGLPSLQLFNLYPMLAMFLKTHTAVLEKIAKIRRVLKTDIQAKRKNININCLNSLIETMVVKQEEERTNKDTLFHDNNMLAILLDLVMAGTETTSTTLQWGILLMMKYPEVQIKKVQKEIYSVLEFGRPPRFEDRHVMPYTHAVIHEFQRFGNVIPHLPHATSTDTYFKGYHIPKGTTVIPLLASALYDKHHWETPLQFNPDHFLDAEGKFVNNEAFLPFSTGRRLCLGENLARMELFIFFTGLLQKFTFTPPHGMELDLDADPCFTLRPKPYLECCAGLK